MKALYLITYAQNYYEGGDKKVTCENYLFENKEEAMQRFFLFIDERDSVAMNNLAEDGFAVDNLAESIKNDYPTTYSGDDGLKNYQVKFEKIKID